MTTTLTFSDSNTFTVTHARHIAAKVATDLKRMQRFYGAPNDAAIERYENELMAFLKAGYLEKVSYGFRRNGLLIEPTLIYTARNLGAQAGGDDDPGRVRPGADITGASFYSYLTQNAAWKALSTVQQAAFQTSLPFVRGGAPEPTVGGYLHQDRIYSSGGRALERATVRAFG
jgi:hypothetical protein